MEHVIEETGRGGRSCFRIVSEDGEPLRIVNPTVTKVKVEETEVVLFYDSNLDPIHEICSFFIEGFPRSAENTKEQAISAIRLLVAYCEICQNHLRDFNEPLAAGFLDFLRGDSRDGILRSFHLSTRRAETTVGSHLKHVRHLCHYLKLDSSPFLRRKRQYLASWRIKNRPTNERYSLSANVREPFDAPMHITLEEYERLLFTANTHSRPVDVIIMRMMFEHGMRRGECLGLTLEDIKDGCYPSGRRRYYLVLRDRLSDGRDQHAKTTMVVRNASDYGSPRYRTKGEGYQEVSISENLYEALLVYVETSRGPNSQPVCNAEAESVSGFDGNQYVFLNAHGKPLRAGAWDKRLRKAFSRAGLHLDSGTRKTNLSHRLRHGYEMTLRYRCGFDERTCMILMRHRSIESQRPYDRPTPERISEIQEEAIESFEVILPRRPSC